MSAVDTIRNLVTPLLPGFRIQYGRWMDGALGDRFAVIKPVGDRPALLTSKGHFTLILMGAVGDDASVPADKATELVEALRDSTTAVADPVFVPTDDGRPVYEIAITA